MHKFNHVSALVAVALLSIGSAEAAVLKADYEFNGNLQSSVAGAPDLLAVNPVGIPSFNSGQYSWTGNSSPAGQGGLVFDNSGGLLTATSYSIFLEFKFNEGQNAWRRRLQDHRGRPR